MNSVGYARQRGPIQPKSPGSLRLSKATISYREGSSLPRDFWRQSISRQSCTDVITGEYWPPCDLAALNERHRAAPEPPARVSDDTLFDLTELRH